MCAVRGDVTATEWRLAIVVVVVCGPGSVGSGPGCLEFLLAAACQQHHAILSAGGVALLWQMHAYTGHHQGQSGSVLSETAYQLALRQTLSDSC